MGLIVGICFGNWNVVLGIAIFFELFWMDKIHAGTYIPPHKMFATCISILLAFHLDLHRAEQILPIIFLVIPLALLAVRLESWQRIFQNQSYDKLLSWSRSCIDEFHPTILIKKSLLQIVCMNSLFFFCSFLILGYVYLYIKPFWPLTLKGFTWNHLWIFALIGAILSLRKIRLYQYLFLGGALLCLGIWI